jgi:chloramphenicol-sensitive protein RarD
MKARRRRQTERASHEASGLIAGIAAFLTWGLIPGYWKLLKSVSAPEILAHRFVWTSLFLVVILSVTRRWSEVSSVVRSQKTLWFCLASGLAIATNWFFFIFAVLIDRVLETSLGYFMTPLVNVLFGAIFLRERLTRLQIVAVALAAAAVLYLTLGYGRWPGIALTLCTTFGLYGLLRKQSGTAAIPGLFVETISILPIAVAYLIWQEVHGQIVFGHCTAPISILLVSTGIVTAVPLFWFGHAARHLRLTTLGFLQYLSPSASFILAVWAYHEPLTRAYLVTFALIWLALVIFTVEAVIRLRSADNRGALAASVSETPA